MEELKHGGHHHHRSDNTSIDKEGERNPTREEAIIIDDRGGAQEHHNQTMDEIYHQNTHDDDENGAGPIKCNVVSNPNNFLNSMVLHNKNDLNDPSEGEHNVKYKEVKQKFKLEAVVINKQLVI